MARQRIAFSIERRKSSVSPRKRRSRKLGYVWLTSESMKYYLGLDWMNGGAIKSDGQNSVEPLIEPLMWRRPPSLLCRRFPNRQPLMLFDAADLEVGDTAGLETCATSFVTGGLDRA